MWSSRFLRPSSIGPQAVLRRINNSPMNTTMDAIAKVGSMAIGFGVPCASASAAAKETEGAMTIKPTTRTRISLIAILQRLRLRLRTLLARQDDADDQREECRPFEQ